MQTKSGKTLATQRKISDHKLRAFVLEIVNADDHLVDGSTDYFFRRYEEFFPTRDQDIEFLIPFFRRRWTSLEGVRKGVAQSYCRAVIGELRQGLRAIWLAEDDYVAEWQLFILQFETHWTVADRILHPPSLYESIQKAIDWLRRNLVMLHTCRNPECRTPFFVADRAQRRFCSEACTEAAQKEHKRRWWSEKGQARRQTSLGRPVREQNTTNLSRIPSAIGDRSSLQDLGVHEASPMRIGPGYIERRKRLPVDVKSERRLKDFIQDIVNETGDRIEYIFSVYAKFFPETNSDEDVIALLPLIGKRLPQPVMPREKLVLRRAIVEELRDNLRTIWSAEDERTARWRLFNLRRMLYRVMNPKTHPDSKNQEPSALDKPIYQALDCLRRNLHKLRRCKNPVCAPPGTPFFIADKGKQQYCSIECSGVAQKEQKLHWWAEKGPQWRKARRRLRKSGNPKRRTL